MKTPIVRLIHQPCDTPSSGGWFSDNDWDERRVTRMEDLIAQLRQAPISGILIDEQFAASSQELNFILGATLGYDSVPIVLNSINNFEAAHATARKYKFDCFLCREDDSDSRDVLMKSTIRRYRRVEDQRTLKVGKLELAFGEVRQSTGKVPLNLSPLQFLLLGTFMERPSKWLKRQDLFRCVWGTRFQETSRQLDIQIGHVRNILKSIDTPYEVLTSHGVGYRFGPVERSDL